VSLLQSSFEVKRAHAEAHLTSKAAFARAFSSSSKVLGREYHASSTGDIMWDITSPYVPFVPEEDESAMELNGYITSTGYSEENAIFWPAIWNNDERILRSHNCYMYALNDMVRANFKRCRSTLGLIDEGNVQLSEENRTESCRYTFHEPGYYFQNFVEGRAETGYMTSQEQTCTTMTLGVAADNANIKWSNSHGAKLIEQDECPEAHYMAALYTEKEAGLAGFHFYRRDHACQDEPGRLCWSHKPGILPVTDRDADDKVIKVLLQANHNYGRDVNYNHCAFFCVPQNSVAATHSDAAKGYGGSIFGR
jgi:hypothetical protein